MIVSEREPVNPEKKYMPDIGNIEGMNTLPPEDRIAVNDVVDDYGNLPATSPEQRIEPKKPYRQAIPQSEFRRNRFLKRAAVVLGVLGAAWHMLPFFHNNEPDQSNAPSVPIADQLSKSISDKLTPNDFRDKLIPNKQPSAEQKRMIAPVPTLERPKR